MSTLAEAVRALRDRNAFRFTFLAMKAMDKKFNRYQRSVQRDFDGALLAAADEARKADGKKKRPKNFYRDAYGHVDVRKLLTDLGQERMGAIRGPFVTLAEAARDAYDDARNSGKRALFDLSETSAIMAGEVMREVSRASVGDYRSQGCGSERYAKGDVQVKLAAARYLAPHIAAEIVEEGRVFILRASVMTGLDARILEMRLNHFPLREWVRTCWKVGINPRVLDPYLPHGYEEAQGLDFFGGEKPKPAVKEQSSP